MPFNRAQFLIEVLGADAARALAKAATRSEYLSQMIVPRAILAMLEAVPAYQGTIPGLDGYELTYAKNENGFSGSLGLYKFEDASIFHVAGALSTAMELDSLLFNSGRNTELQRLGKSIDLMAKAHLVGEELAKDEKDPYGNNWCKKCQKKHPGFKGMLMHGATKEAVAADTDRSDREYAAGPKKPLEKKALGEGAGKSAGPVAPAAPQAPTASAPQHTTPQKLPKAGASATMPKPPKPVTSSTVKLTRSEQTRACQVCSLRQFNADGKFVGCLCFRALSKSVDRVDHSEYVELHLGEGWDRDTIVTFLESVGRK